MPNSLIATAIGLGMAYAAAPGEVNTEALRRGVRWGHVQLCSLKPAL